jgi:hypothetical protein
MAPLPWARIWEKLVFHAGPDPAQINGDHFVEGIRGFVGQIAHRTQDTGVVECHVQVVGLDLAQAIDRNASPCLGELILHGPRYVLNWHVGVKAVLVEEVNAFGFEPFERFFGNLADMLRSAVQTRRLSVLNMLFF